MKVTPAMTNESGNLLAGQADFLDIDGQGIKISLGSYGDLGEVTLDSTTWPHITGRFSARDLFGIAAQCVAVAGQIVAEFGVEDPYEDEIRKLYTRETAEGK